MTPYKTGAESESCPLKLSSKQVSENSAPDFPQAETRAFLLLILAFFILAMSSIQSALASDIPSQINFRNMLAGHDIAIGEVQSIYQDKQGFIWLGARNALVRYDGYAFIEAKILEDESDFSKNRPSGRVGEILEDSRGDVWVATSAGLFKLDLDRNLLIRLKGNNEEDNQLFHTGVGYIAESSTGDIVTVTAKGLTIIDPHSIKTTFVLHKPGVADSIPNNTIHDIFRDSKNRIWVGTDLGLSLMLWETKTFKNFIPDPDNPNSVSHNAIRAIAEDAAGNIWGGTQGDGLYKLSVDSETFTHYEHQKDDPYSIVDNDIRVIFKDSKDVLWIGTDRGGFSLYDQEKDRFIPFTYIEGAPGALATNTLRSIFEDRNGDIWIGTFTSGVNFHDRSSVAISMYQHDPNNPNSLSHKEVIDLTVDKEGYIWMGVGRGINRFDRKHKKFKRYTKKDEKYDFVSSFTDKQGQVWLGSWGVAYLKYNPESDSFDQMPFDGTLSGKGSKDYEVLNDSVVWSYCETSDGLFWIGTHYGGLNQYHKDSGHYTNYSMSKADPNSLSDNIVWVCMEDSQGRFWVGTQIGLNIMNRETGAFKKYFSSADDEYSLKNNSVIAAFEDSKGQIWFGTNGGLHRYLPEKDGFEAITTNDGLLDNTVRSINEDAKGHLWLGTNKGIVNYDPENNIFKNYQNINGQKIGRINTAAVSAAGEMVFGGENGLIIMDVNRLSINKTPPPVALTEFSMFTKPISFNSDDGVLSKVINKTHNIELDYTKTMFSFKFSALNYRDPEKNQYAYKMEGFDNDWRMIGKQREAQYTNLSAGNYTFRVKASNNDLIWNEVGTAIKIRQLPPPWRTWWAYTIYTFLFLFALFQFVNHQRKKRRFVEQQNILLEAKVSERTAELRAKNNDIQSMLNNMRQGLFTVEEGGIIHAEYSRYMEEIFETDLIKGQSVFNLIFEKAELNSDERFQISTAIDAIVGEADFNFDFNGHLIIREYNVRIGSRQKILSLDWNPILDGNIITKLMATVRDVTQLKKIEGEAKKQQRELDIIAELIKVSTQKYMDFDKASSRFLDEIHDHLSNENFSNKLFELIIRNIHTIKGNSRTYHFSLISSAAHQAETSLTKIYEIIKSEPARLKRERKNIIAAVDSVRSILQEYDNIFYKVLHNDDAIHTGKGSGGYWFSQHTVTNILQNIDAFKAQYPESKEIAHIKQVINQSISLSLEDTLTDLIKSLPEIAQQLGKEPPQITITANDIRVHADAQELLNNVFLHVLRNAIDHGIESKPERIQAKKSLQGHIQIKIITNSDNVAIKVSDDGKGLNIKRLFEIGVEHNAWQATDKPAPDEIANLIFKSAVTTKNVVTDISGRGAGMDAVKQFLVEHGGDIRIHLLEDTESDYIPFETIISLPNKFFIEA